MKCNLGQFFEVIKSIALKSVTAEWENSVGEWGYSELKSAPQLVFVLWACDIWEVENYCLIISQNTDSYSSLLV